MKRLVSLTQNVRFKNECTARYPCYEDETPILYLININFDCLVGTVNFHSESSKLFCLDYLMPSDRIVNILHLVYLAEFTLSGFYRIGCESFHGADIIRNGGKHD